MIDQIRHFVFGIQYGVCTLSTFWTNYFRVKIYFTYWFVANHTSDRLSIVNIQFYPPVTASNSTHSQASRFPQ